MTDLVERLRVDLLIEQTKMKKTFDRIEKLTAALELQQARSKELESAISTTVEDLCLRAERASDSDVAQMLWGIAEDLEKAALEGENLIQPGRDNEGC